MAQGSRWGWSEQWDQLAIAPPTCLTVDLVEETIVLRVWDPLDPEHEVARVAVSPLAARKVGAQLLTLAAAGEWEAMGRTLTAALRDTATRPVELPPEGDDEPTSVDAPLVQTGRCPWCGAPAIAAEEQPHEGEVEWIGRCDARWGVREDRLEVITPCPHAPRGRVP